MPLHILFFTQGHYGDRILENVRRRAPSGWEIGHIALPKALPSVIEDPDVFVRKLNLSRAWGLVIFLGESPSAFSLVSEILRKVEAKAVIAPVDDYSWLPKGLENQIRSDLSEIGVGFAVPRPFCSLVPVGTPAIDEFANLFGMPKLEIETENGLAKSVRVIRGAPCGSTWYMAEKLSGAEIKDLESKGALAVQTYPCLASRRMERLFSDAPIHVAGRIAARSVSEALKR